MKEFTNKKGLFRAVLDRYITRFASKHEAQLFCEEKSVESALEDYFTEIAACFTSTDTPAGANVRSAVKFRRTVTRRRSQNI